jgi:hypothetical protein
MTYEEEVKRWRNNASADPRSIPVTLLQAQLLDAANTVEALDKENDQLVELGELANEKVQKLKKGIYDLIVPKGHKQ